MTAPVCSRMVFASVALESAAGTNRGGFVSSYDTSLWAEEEQKAVLSVRVSDQVACVVGISANRVP
jgi:hypothetical protein